MDIAHKNKAQGTVLSGAVAQVSLVGRMGYRERTSMRKRWKVWYAARIVCVRGAHVTKMESNVDAVRCRSTSLLTPPLTTTTTTTTATHTPQAPSSVLSFLHVGHYRGAQEPQKPRQTCPSRLSPWLPFIPVPRLLHPACDAARVYAVPNGEEAGRTRTKSSMLMALDPVHRCFVSNRRLFARFSVVARYIYIFLYSMYGLRVARQHPRQESVSVVGAGPRKGRKRKGMIRLWRIAH